MTEARSRDARDMAAKREASSDRVVGVTDTLVHWTSLGAVAVLALLTIIGLIALVAELPSLIREAAITALESLFGGILLLFILIELYQIARLYFQRAQVIDKVFEVGIVALVRQLIVAEFLHYSVLQLLAIAALVLSLGCSWYLTRRVRVHSDDPAPIVDQ